MRVGERLTAQPSAPSGAPRPDPVSGNVCIFLLHAAPTPKVSGLPSLHVRGDGASLSQTLEAFVRVVQEDPVLRFEVRLRRVGCSQNKKLELDNSH